MKIGFVGLGDQGGPMPLRLLEAGHEVTVWARRPEACAPFAEAGAKVAPDLQTLAQQSDWIGICVFDDAGVRQVCEAIMPHMRSGGTIVVHSTVHPDTCRDLAALAEARDLVFVDAPVSGGNVRAREGSLTIMIGSSEEAFAASEAVLRAYATTIVRTGEPGAGQAAKLVNNTLLAAHAAIAHAALQTSEQIGLDRAGIIQIVNASSGRSYGFELFGAIGMAGFARVSSIFDKDVSLLSGYIAPDAPMRPFIELTEHLLDELRPLAT